MIASKSGGDVAGVPPRGRGKGCSALDFLIRQKGFPGATSRTRNYEYKAIRYSRRREQSSYREIRGNRGRVWKGSKKNLGGGGLRVRVSR